MSFRRRGRRLRRKFTNYRHLLPDLLELYGNFCFYCGNPIQGTPDIDHVKPRSKGGLNKLKNLRISCPSCNRSKGAKSLNEFLKYRNQAELFITTSAKWLNRNQKFMRAGTIIATASPYIEIVIYVAPPTYEYILKPFGKGFMKGYRLATRDKAHPEFYQASAMLAGCQYHILDIKSPNGSSPASTDHRPSGAQPSSAPVPDLAGTIPCPHCVGTGRLPSSASVPNFAAGTVTTEPDSPAERVDGVAVDEALPAMSSHDH